MKSHVLLLVAWLLSLTTFLLSPFLQAQVPNGQAENDARISISDPGNITPSLSLIGKVQVEGGVDLSKDTAVVLDCGSKGRSFANVDGHGNFSFMLSGDRAPGRRAFNNPELTDFSLANCSVYAQAPGYRSAASTLAGENGNGIIQVGPLVLQPLSSVHSSEDFTVSVASLAAPDKAKQQFEKGREQERKGKWAAASDYFRKAIQVYPRYALAWLELGRTQVQQNNFIDAKQSFQQATSQDSRFVPAYLELARMQAGQKEWKALAETTGRMVQLAPDSSPMFWFLDAAANYNLHDLPRAETSATRGLRLDRDHRVPQLEYLYGLILGTRQDYAAAVQHIKAYLQLVPHAADGQNAEKDLSDFEHLASMPSAASQGQQATELETSKR